jgi:C4-dicarboxylate-specific signal transduction histidine kinase/CheY-like chemotaxis protein
MRPDFRVGQDSLRHRIIGAAVVAGLVLMGAFAVLLVLSSGMRNDLGRATDAFIEEQDIADELLRAVSRQLVAASFFGQLQDQSHMEDFRSAGDEVYDGIRRYLGGTMTPAQRLQLESVKEQHERMEVAAAQASDQFLHGRETDGHRYADAMIAHSRLLQHELDTFLGMREQDLVALRERQAATFGYVYLAAGALAILLITGFIITASFLNRRIRAPLEALMNATTRIASGDLQSRVQSRYNDEFAAVAENFNHMTARLADTNLEIEQRNAQLQTAVDTLKAMQAELIQTEKLSAMGRLMAGLAHELNNPLASVLGYAELLDKHLGGPESNIGDRTEVRAALVQPLLEQAVRARALVRDFLQYARQDHAGLSGVRLHDALDVIVRLRAFAFKQAGLGIHLDEDAEACVNAKPQRLEQIFLNLTNNAFDAMKPRGHGTLHVSSRTQNDFVTVCFVDDGPGFEFPDRIFEPFFTTKPVGAGTGLGLTIVHQFMEEFGGSVRAENRPEGGVRITLRFHAAAADAVIDAGVVTRVAPTDLIRDARILVVEDEAPLRQLQQRLLERLGATVTLANDAHEAQWLIDSNVFDLIVSDVRMPGTLSGVDLFRWIEKARPHLANRFLLVTGDVTGEDIAEFALYHGDRVLNKPFLMQDYVDTMNRVLASPVPALS